MTMITEESLKESALALEKALNESAKNSAEAIELLKQIEPFIIEAKSVTSIASFNFRRLYFDRPFIEGTLANHHSLPNLYAKFANHFEGLET